MPSASAVGIPIQTGVPLGGRLQRHVLGIFLFVLVQVFGGVVVGDGPLADAFVVDFAHCEGISHFLLFLGVHQTGFADEGHCLTLRFLGHVFPVVRLLFSSGSSCSIDHCFFGIKGGNGVLLECVR